MIAISFAENLKRIREELKMSQADLARELGISYQTYNGYETKGNEPKYDLLVKIANILCVTTDELLGAKPPEDNWVELYGILKNYGFKVNIDENTITLKIEITSDENVSDSIITYLVGTIKKSEITELMAIFNNRLSVYREPMLADFLADQLIPKMKKERFEIPQPPDDYPKNL